MEYITNLLYRFFFEIDIRMFLNRENTKQQEGPFINGEGRYVGNRESRGIKLLCFALGDGEGI